MPLSHLIPGDMMGREWKIGDPVDYSTDGWMDAQNWHGSSDDDEINGSSYSQDDSYSDKAWKLYNDCKDEEALYYINLALDLNDRSHKNWNRKGLILEGLKRFDESIECFDRSLDIYESSTVLNNRARVLMRKAAQLLEKSKELKNGLNLLYEAREIINESINTFSQEKDEEQYQNILTLKESIDFYIGYETTFQEKLETLKKHDKSELFTITGIKFFGYNPKLVPGASLRLVKESENESDRDAIALYIDDTQVGYVANSEYSTYEMTSTASELKDKFSDKACGEYLFYLERYSAIQFAIGRLIK